MSLVLSSWCDLVFLRVLSKFLSQALDLLILSLQFLLQLFDLLLVLFLNELVIVVVKELSVLLYFHCLQGLED